MCGPSIKRKEYHQYCPYVPVFEYSFISAVSACVLIIFFFRLSTISCNEKFSILSVRGLDPAKSNCNRLFRLLSMYATVADVCHYFNFFFLIYHVIIGCFLFQINYSRELKSAEVKISKCNDINAFAQIQHHYLSHGFNLSFQ